MVKKNHTLWNKHVIIAVVLFKHKYIKVHCQNHWCPDLVNMQIIIIIFFLFKQIIHIFSHHMLYLHKYTHSKVLKVARCPWQCNVHGTTNELFWGLLKIGLGMTAVMCNILHADYMVFPFTLNNGNAITSHFHVITSRRSLCAPLRKMCSVRIKSVFSAFW